MARVASSSIDHKAPLLLNGSAGTAGQVLTSGGPSAPATWETSGASVDPADAASLALALDTSPPPF